MKMTMPTTAVEILKQAYLYREDGFQNERFNELYLDWCKATNYADTDGKPAFTSKSTASQQEHAPLLLFHQTLKHERVRVEPIE